MGPKISKPLNSLDYIYKVERSEALLSQRKKKKLILSSMFKRVLASKRPLTPVSLLCLPESSIISIIQFIPNDIKSLLSVSPHWYFYITEVIDHTFNSIESGFAMMHSHLITFKKSHTYLKEIRASNKRGFRVDRVIIAEILPILKSHTLKLRYNYKYHKSNVLYTAEFKIDCTDKGKRKIWCHRDECKYHGTDSIRAYTQQIPVVNIGDNIELAINWFSLFGLLRLETIIWQLPILQNSQKILKSLQLTNEESLQKKFRLHQISRNSEVEVNCSEWYDSKYYPVPVQALEYDLFLPFLKIVKFEFTGSEIIVSKSTFRAEKPGIVPESVMLIGICVEVLEENCEVKQEVKKVGLLYDRHVPIRLRIGDELIVYVSRGG